MSQHLINDFIHRTYLFKPFQREYMNNKKITKYQASNRDNNNAPQNFEGGVTMLKPITPAQARSENAHGGIVDIII